MLHIFSKIYEQQGNTFVCTSISLDVTKENPQCGIPGVLNAFIVMKIKQRPRILPGADARHSKDLIQIVSNSLES